ncbi:hypothetical protein BDB00DRAFT_792836 [Zychaea mexicana]|uniref:uncharacterized protein n=1 Tax=Zychaea mexicana TaxID=64656 RepID=UPI0022FF19F9|nr:uncharacterized protein BDB00DRAFT_792836 [Zychaea mexicana]KAI9484456.1 hypothetical protein BDB00DRAFT_792836 [Zychaea mexicana]
MAILTFVTDYLHQWTAKEDLIKLGLQLFLDNTIIVDKLMLSGLRTLLQEELSILQDASDWTRHDNRSLLGMTNRLAAQDNVVSPLMSENDEVASYRAYSVPMS